MNASDPGSPTTASPAPATRVWQTFICDSRRWRAFEPRAGDVLVCTAYKSGTSWLQRICSLLIFGSTELDGSLHAISPWFENDREPVEAVCARLAGQTHRRFIKTHCPFNAIPYWPEVDYVFVGRDPRDVVVSLWHQLQQGERLRAAAPADEAFSAYLPLWLERAAVEGERDGWPYWSYFDHAATFWRARDRHNVHLTHYQELLDDLDGRMRWLAQRLGCPIDEAAWAGWVEAARFRTMRDDPRMVPGLTEGWWGSRSFYRSGTSGGWRDLFEPEDEAHYSRVATARLPVDLYTWLHREPPRAGHDPC